MRKIKFEQGKIYHIFNRGVEKRMIFKNDSNRWRFLQGLFLFNDEKGAANLLYRLERDKKAMNFRVLREFVADKQRNPLVRILADCLMPNHYHLLVEEIKEGGISRFMHKLGVGYAKYFNLKYDRVGSLFQGPFKAIAVENDIYLQYLLVYINVINPAGLIEQNLKEKGINDVDRVLKFVEQYPWSTHREYLGLRESIIIEKGIFEELFPTPAIYRKFAQEVIVSKKYNAIRHLLLE